MKNVHEHLVVIALGADRRDIVPVISDLVCSNHCQIESTHMHRCCEDFTVTLLISGHWNAIAKMEMALDALEQETGYEIIYKRTKQTEHAVPGIPYIVQVTTAYQSCILSEISAFFAEQAVTIREVTGYRYIAQQTCAEMFHLQMVVELSVDMNLSTFREQFMLFCDDLNIDAILEPDRV